MKHLLIIMLIFYSVTTSAQVRRAFTTEPPSFLKEKLIFKKNGTYSYIFHTCYYTRSVNGTYIQKGDSIVLQSFHMSPAYSPFGEDTANSICCNYGKMKYMILGKKKLTFADTARKPNYLIRRTLINRLF